MIIIIVITWIKTYKLINNNFYEQQSATRKEDNYTMPIIKLL